MCVILSATFTGRPTADQPSAKEKKSFGTEMAKMGFTAKLTMGQWVKGKTGHQI